MDQRLMKAVFSLAAIGLAACSSETANTTAAKTDAESAAKAPAGPPQPVAAKTAFWAMYTPARQWAKDLVLLRLTPKDVPGFKNEAGKAAMWQATFASPGEHQYRVYSYAVAAAPPDIYKGVITRLPAPWGGGTRDTMPIDLSLFNVDSDAAKSSPFSRDSNLSLYDCSMQSAPKA